MKTLALSLIMLLPSCALSAPAVGSDGPGLELDAWDAQSPASSVSTSAAYASPAEKESTSSATSITQFKGLQCQASASVMYSECRWFACGPDGCLAIQMCWRMREDGFPTCSFWDYPDDEMCCPDNAGQAVSAVD